METQTKIKNILVALDFSAHSAAAEDYAIDLARRYDAALELVYVYYSITYALPEGYVLVTPEQLGEILARFRTQLEAAKRRAVDTGVARVQASLLEGDPAHENRATRDRASARLDRDGHERAYRFGPRGARLGGCEGRAVCELSGADGSGGVRPEAHSFFPPYSCRRYWIVRAEIPRISAARDVDPPVYSSVFRIR